MKRGLKEKVPLLFGRSAHVEEYSPMKRGLKESMSRNARWTISR